MAERILEFKLVLRDRSNLPINVAASEVRMSLLDALYKKAAEDFDVVNIIFEPNPREE